MIDDGDTARVPGKSEQSIWVDFLLSIRQLCRGEGVADLVGLGNTVKWAERPVFAGG